MIQTHCFDRIWIDAKQAELRLRDPGLLEKCIHALQLLGLLADSDLPFVFKGGAFTLNQALDDTIGTALHISEIRLRPQDPVTALIDAARKRLENHLIGPALDMDNLKIAAARAACLAALIRNPTSPLTLDDLRYDPARVAELAPLNIARSPRLNRLKQTNAEAFFLWHKVDTLLNTPQV